MPKAKQISLNNTLIDIGDGNCEIWDVTESSGTYSITGHSTTPYADITTALSNNTSVVLRYPDGRLFYLAGNFGTGNEARYSFTYNEATARMIIGIYSNNTITYTTPTGGAPQYHRSTDTTYGIGSENYYGHNKVINNLTTASYTEGESLSAYQGKVLKDAIDGKQASITGGASTITSSNLTASRALVSNGSGKVAVSAVTATELGYLDGVTSAIQTQLNALKRHVVTTAGTNLNDYLTTGVYYFSVSVTPTNIPAGVNGILIVYSMQAAETATNFCKQIWLRHGTPGVNSYQMWERSIGTAAGDSWSEWVRYLTTSDTLAPGAASSILNNDLTASRALISNGNGKVAVSSTTLQELGYVHGVTSPIQTQLNGKQNTITGAASVIATSNLTASRALISNGSGKVAVSAVTSTELGYLNGVTSNVQTQINNITPVARSSNYDEDKMNNISVTNNVNFDMGSFQLTKGSWLVTLNAQFNANATGYRQMWLSNSAGGGNLVVAGRVSSPAANGAITQINVTLPLNVSATTTYYIVVRQNSGAALTTSVRYSLVRLLDQS